MPLNLLPPPHSPDCEPCIPCEHDRRALGHLPPAEVGRQRETAMKTGWTLGPEHPDYGFTLERRERHIRTTSSTGKVASGSSAAPHSARLGILCVRPEAATPDPLLAIRDRMNARLAAGEPVRIIRASLVMEGV